MSDMRVLGLFAKQPQPGIVKTRLAGQSSDDWAVGVAAAFLADTVDRLEGVAAHRVLVFTPRDAEDFFKEVAKGRFTLTAQVEGDLGERMAAFLADQFAAGAKSIVIVGTDSPTLPITFVEQAFQELEQVDVVLGPATDGGYYLFGCARAVPHLFEGITWSSSQVLQQTISRLDDLSSVPPGLTRRLTLALLPPWYDVDTLDDWRMLQGHVAALRRAGLDPGVPHTERLLQCQLP